MKITRRRVIIVLVLVLGILVVTNYPRRIDRARSQISRGYRRHSQGQYPEAEAHYRKALSLITPPEARYILCRDSYAFALVSLGYVLLASGEIDEARELAEQLIEDAKPGNHVRMLAYGNVLQGVLACIDRNMVAAERHLDTALDMEARLNEPDLRGRIYVTIAHVRYRQARPDAAREAALRAGQILHYFHDPWTNTQLKKLLVELAIDKGRFNEARGHCEEILKGRAAVSLFDRISAHLALARIWYIRGDLAAQTAAFEAAVREAEQAGLQSEWMAATWIGVYICRGDFAKAEETLVRIAPQFEGNRNAFLRLPILQQQAALYIATDRGEEAEEVISEIEAIGARGDTLMTLSAQAMQAGWRHHNEDYETAERLRRSILDVFERGGSIVEVIWHRTALAHTLIEQGKSEEAQALLDDALAAAERIGSVPNLLLIHLHMGTLHLRQGNGQHAARSLERSLAWAEQLGARLYIAEIHAKLAEVALAQGDQGAARDHLNTALTLFQEMGLGKDIDKVNASLAELDAPD